MTEPTAEQPKPVETVEDGRRWEIRHYQAADEHDDEQARLAALAGLRDQIRADGYVLLVDSLTLTGSQRVILTDGGNGFRSWEPGPLAWDGTITTWSAMATERGHDTGDLTPTGEADDEGRVWFTVPDDVKELGGEVRLRHGFGQESVIAYAYDATEDAERMGYMIAVEVDENVVSVVLFPGTGALSVEPDDRDPEDDDE